MIAKIIIWIAPHAWKITHSIILYCAPTQLVCIYINYNIYIMYKIIFIIILVDLVKIIDIIYILLKLDYLLCKAYVRIKQRHVNMR